MATSQPQYLSPGLNLATMSRGSALARTLQLPPGVAVEVRAAKPSGDCFYDCLDSLLPRRPPSPPGAAHDHDDASGAQLQRPSGLVSSQSMRDLVAAKMTEELFELYKMYAMAGVEDFAWLHHHRAPTSLAELQAYARRSGKDAVRPSLDRLCRHSRGMTACAPA
eukprot:SAG22_NODE_856_length_6839_cov_3.284570_1_plen_165_part_00